MMTVPSENHPGSPLNGVLQKWGKSRCQILNEYWFNVAPNSIHARPWFGGDSNQCYNRPNCGLE